MRATYPNAQIICHPSITVAQAIEVCHRHGRKLSQTACGNFALSAEPTTVPDALLVLLLSGDAEGAVDGPT